MPDYDFDIGVIGGGAAGLTITAGSAQLGAKTLLVEKEKELGGEKQVIIKDSEGKTIHLKSDAILVAMGRAPNTGGLNLENIGVEFERTGITVDRRLRTTQKHIYSAGDVSGGYQFTHAAGYEGGIVVSNSIFRLPRKTDYTYLPWCTFTDPPLGSIGLQRKKGLRFFFNLKGRDCSN